jgi:3'-phosphoadenosine 5'-phosphosulfate sulfotransferase (PAPS reductase)/FAD synthetase
MSTVDDKVAESFGIVRDALSAHLDGHLLAARVILFSGGDDSTVLAHMFRKFATHIAHANTTIGIEQTRQFVRDTAAGWNLPLIEKVAPTSYRDLVLERGFPGPAQHWKMYTRLKERCLEQVRNELITNPRKQRVLFIAGRRRDESARRVDVPLNSRKGSTIWAAPLAFWSKLDLNDYRRAHPDVPRNEVSALLHMSGECLCGAFAKRDELDQIADWFPDVAAEIHALEAEVAARPGIPAEACKWGWGAYRGDVKRSKVGEMCSSCEGNDPA